MRSHSSPTLCTSSMRVTSLLQNLGSNLTSSSSTSTCCSSCCTTLGGDAQQQWALNSLNLFVLSHLIILPHQLHRTYISLVWNRHRVRLYLFPDVVVAEEAANLPSSQHAVWVRVFVLGQHVYTHGLQLGGVQGSVDNTRTYIYLQFISAVSFFRNNSKYWNILFVCVCMSNSGH